jgi:hypothetical protein
MKKIFVIAGPEESGKSALIDTIIKECQEINFIGLKMNPTPRRQQIDVLIQQSFHDLILISSVTETSFFELLLHLTNYPIANKKFVIELSTNNQQQYTTEYYTSKAFFYFTN